MDERIFNFFIYFAGGVAGELGVRFHKRSGTETEKIDFLRSHVPTDHRKARRFDLPQSFTPEQWRAQLRIDGALPILEPILTELRAPKSSFIYCLTPILDGTPTWDQMSGPGAFRGSDVNDLGREGHMPDYLADYTDGRHFHLDKLIDDDFLNAIRILFKNNHYVSASKLLMCCIDTLAFVEFGDSQHNFTKWLDQYCDLSVVGVTAGELWEYRNSVLHMTTLDSRSVLRGDTVRIAPYVAPRELLPPRNEESVKPFNLLELVHTVSAGIECWGASYNTSPDKYLDFVIRYDMIISDKRVSAFVLSNETHE